MSSGFVLEMSGITKAFPGVVALDDVHLAVAAGEVHGLVGENGAGKSTIIKTLAGVYQRDSGDITFDGENLIEISSATVFDKGIRFVHQELNLVPHFTVLESIFMGQELTGITGIKSKEMRIRAEQTLRDLLGLDIPLKALIRDLTPAERKLIQIARALVIEGAKLVVFDEPTAPLASTEVQKVLAAVRRLRDQGIAVLYVSHYLAEIIELCDRVTVFRNGKDVGVMDITPDSAVRELVHMIVGRELDEMFPSRTSAAGDPVLEVSGISDRSRISDISFDVHEGEIVGLAGVLGAGCEEIVDALVGLRPAKTGSITLRGKKLTSSSPSKALSRGMVLIPRDRRNDGLVLELSVARNITLSTLSAVAFAGIVSKKKILAQAREMIAALDIRPPDPEKAARFLSGGNQQKVVLARSLLAKAKMFIFDEPTIGVDVGAKTEIYRLIARLAEEGSGILISSNEPAELLGLCDRVLVVVRGHIVSEHRAGELTRDELVARMTGGVL